MAQTPAQPQAPSAQPQTSSAPRAARPAQPRTTASQTDPLDSSDPNAIAAAIREIEANKRPDRIQALVRRIRSGLPPELLEQAVDVVLAPPARDTRLVIELSRHRRASIRTKAARALATVRGANALQTAVALLDDPSPEVRGAASISIGSLGPASAMDKLLLAANRGAPEAVAVIGEHARPSHVERVLASLDERSFSVLGPAVRKWADRKNLPARIRIAVVTRLSTMSTPASRQMLQEIATQLPEGDAVRDAAEKALAPAEPANTATTPSGDAT